MNCEALTSSYTFDENSVPESYFLHSFNIEYVSLFLFSFFSFYYHSLSYSLSYSPFIINNFVVRKLKCENGRRGRHQ